MKSLFALSAFTLLVSTQVALADPGSDSCGVDPHERARQLLAHPTPVSVSSGGSPAAAATPGPTDPHEIARRRLVSPPEAYAAARLADMTDGQVRLDPHDRARTLILSIVQPARAADTRNEPLLLAGHSPIDSSGCEVSAWR